MLLVREVLAHLLGRPAAQDVADAADEVADELGLPVPPGRRTGGQAVGLGERGQQREGERVLHGGGHLLDGGGVVEVAPGGDVGQEQVVAHHRLQHRHVGGVEPEPRSDRGQQVDAHVGVVARVALADVVQQGADHEQVGPVGARHEPGRVGRRLHEVPVDGEAVVGVALRLAPHGFPLGQDVHPQAQLVEGLDHRDGRVTGQEEVDEAPPARRRARASGSGAEPATRRSSDARWMRVPPAAAAAAARSSRLGSAVGRRRR